jgi:hypothetical protein
MTAQQIAASDLNTTLSEVLAQIQHMSTDELQDGVHRRMEFRLCAGCHRAYLANPLGIPRRVPVGKN